MIGNFSIEKLFETIRDHLPPDVEPVKAVSRFESKGILRRTFNILEAYGRQGDINHITGDVHYLSYLLKGKKTILTIHDCGIVKNSSGIKNHMLRLFWYVLPSKMVSTITVISDFTKNDLLKIINFPIDKIHVVPDCISYEYSYSENIFNYRKPTILQMGTKENKNIIRLCRALKGIPCCLEIVGIVNEEQRKILHRCSIEYRNYHNLSEKDLIKKYKGCDMIAFVSTYEGFGLPILEGNAIGRPVVTSNIPPMQEVAGDAACLVNPYDEFDIRKGFLKVIEDESYREELVRNGLKNVRRFRPEEIAEKYAKIYRTLASP